MNVPVPTNTIVALTLVGALLTGLVAGLLVVPIGGVFENGGNGETPVDSGANVSAQLSADAPTPNQGFTPAVQTQSRYEEEYEDEHEEEYEDEYYEEAEDEDERDD